MKLEFELKQANNVLPNKENTNFIKELSNILKSNKILLNNSCDTTMEDEEKISGKTKLSEEQKEMLENMRQEGAIYKVTYLEDDCEDWRTELKNQKTGETFQELEFPHDIYHQVGVNSLVKYENGKYSVVEGTSVYDIYPNVIGRYCENEGVYIAQSGKYETIDELHKSTNINDKNKATNPITKILKVAVKNLLKMVKLKK